MNANELADELDDIDAYEKHQTLLGKSAEMLRQQQAEIEALKSELDRAVELYTDKAIENEALRMMLANRNDALDKLELK